MSISKLALQSSSGRVEPGSLSYTTPGTYYWTCPAGITTVDVTGQGGSSSSTTGWYGVSGLYVIIMDGSTSGTNLGSSITYETVEAEMSSYASAMNSITTSSGGASYTDRQGVTYFKFASDGDWYRLRTTRSGIYRRVGTFNTSYNIGSGTIPEPAPFGFHYLTGGDIEEYKTVTTYGTDSTAFGQTFPDNTAQSTVSSISVTEGVEYTIVVGTDAGADTAFISFDYY